MNTTWITSTSGFSFAPTSCEEFQADGDAGRSDRGKTGGKYCRTGKTFIWAISTSSDHLVLEERRRGLTQIRVFPGMAVNDHYLDFDEPAYRANLGMNPSSIPRRSASNILP
jgi:hypothetical protein